MINETNKHSWCVNAEHAISGNNDGTTKICCMIKNDSSPIPVLGEVKILDHFNRKSFVDVRNALAEGQRHSACSNCWDEEDSGRKSKRQRDNEKYTHELMHGGRPYDGIVKVELNLGNTCNIKCRTCHPAISSSWMREYYDVYEKSTTTYNLWAEGMRKYHQSYDDESPFWDDIEEHLPTIKQFDFYGGEPFMSKKMWQLIGIAAEKGYANEIELHYNTNGTQWPSKEIESWKKFKGINLSFSIDGTGEQFEYMRFLAKWDVVKRNIENARNYRDTVGNMSLSWCITLSSLNIYYLPEVLDEYYRNYSDIGLYLNLVHGPEHFNISKLPEHVKWKVIERLESIPKEYVSAWYQLPGIIGFIRDGEPSVELWEEFKKRVGTHDEYRKQNFAKTFPEYSEII